MYCFLLRPTLPQASSHQIAYREQRLHPWLPERLQMGALHLTAERREGWDDLSALRCHSELLLKPERETFPWTTMRGDAKVIGTRERQLSLLIQRTPRCRGERVPIQHRLGGWGHWLRGCTASEQWLRSLPSSSNGVAIQLVLSSTCN